MTAPFPAAATDLPLGRPHGATARLVAGSSSLSGDAYRPALPMNRANLRCLGLSVGIAIALAGCDMAAARPDGLRADRACIDGVEYFSVQGHGGMIYTPHLKRDGRPFLCANAA